MRFWPTNRKSQLWLGIMYLVIAASEFLDWSRTTHHSWLIFMVCLFLFTGTMSIWSYSNSFWILEPDVLRIQRAFRQWRVPYADIIAVEPYVSSWVGDGQFILRFDARRSNRKPARVYLNPENQELFFSMLQQRAPQAEYIFTTPARLSIQS